MLWKYKKLLFTFPKTEVDLPWIQSEAYCFERSSKYHNFSGLNVNKFPEKMLLRGPNYIVSISKMCLTSNNWGNCVIKIICVYPIFPTVRGVWRKLATCVLLFQIDLRWPIGFIHFWPNLVSLHFCFQRKYLLHSCERWTLLCLFYKWRNWNPERQRELLKVTQQLGSGARTKTQASNHSV